MQQGSAKLAVLAAIWLAVVGAVTIRMAAYSATAGAAVASPAEWPGHSGIERRDGLPTLVMFAHPRCPCTRASLGELERLMAAAAGRVTTRVLFIRPAGMTSDWAQTDLWRMASAIPGVTVHQDDSGAESTRFGAGTSGHTVLYDAAGRLLFQGGITLARGHAGDNPGRGAVEALLGGALFDRATTPVFGCDLFEPGCQTGGELCTP